MYKNNKNFEAMNRKENLTVKEVKQKNKEIEQIFLEKYDFEFDAVFLKEAKIKDRRQIYISGELYDKISAYLRTITEGQVSMVGYVHNVLAHHIVEYRDMINELYDSRVKKNSPL